MKLNLALCPGLILLAATAAAAPRVIVLGNEPHGRTPAIIGYNLGDDLPGSNVGQWLAYSGANGVRFWWKCFPLRRDDAGAGGTEVRALEDLRRARATLRADPLDGGAIDWSYFDAQVAAAYGGVVEGMAGDCYALSAVCEAGLRPLVMIEDLCDRAHKRSSVAEKIMWCRRTLGSEIPGSRSSSRNINTRYRVRRNCMRPGLSRQRPRGTGESTAHRASALAFISRSASA